MSQLSYLPLPSISLVLTTNQIFIPTQPIGDDADIDSFRAIPNIDSFTTVDQREYPPLECQHLSYIFRAQPAKVRQASSTTRRKSWWSTRRNDGLSLLFDPIRRLFSHHSRNQ